MGMHFATSSIAQTALTHESTSNKEQGP